jgi:hypothetical protein
LTQPSIGTSRNAAHIDSKKSFLSAARFVLTVLQGPSILDSMVDLPTKSQSGGSTSAKPSVTLAAAARPVQAPAGLQDLCGMTWLSERKYLQDYAQNDYSGAGEIVELGCWLGSLTVPLLLGLKQNKVAAKGFDTVHAYDLFQWSAWMEPHYNEKMFSRHPKPGESFLAEFLHQVLPYDTEGRLVVHAGDLLRAGWCGRKIEMLVVDVMKSWDLANGVLKDFYSCLIPGQSYVFHQDFSHCWTPWIHLIQYHLRDYFQPIVDLPDGSTFVFKFIKPIPNEILHRVYSFADFSDQQIAETFDYSHSLIASNLAKPNDRWKCTEVQAARVLTYGLQRKKEQAQQELRAAVGRGFAIDGALKVAQQHLGLILP